MYNVLEKMPGFRTVLDVLNTELYNFLKITIRVAYIVYFLVHSVSCNVHSSAR